MYLLSPQLLLHPLVPHGNKTYHWLFWHFLLLERNFYYMLCSHLESYLQPRLLFLSLHLLAPGQEFLSLFHCYCNLSVYMHLQSVKDISLFLLLTNFSLFSKKTNSPCRSNNIHKDIWFNSIFASRKLTLLFSKASYQLGSNSDLPSCRLSLLHTASQSDFPHAQPFHR